MYTVFAQLIQHKSQVEKSCKTGFMASLDLTYSLYCTLSFDHTCVCFLMHGASQGACCQVNLGDGDVKGL